MQLQGARRAHGDLGLVVVLTALDLEYQAVRAHLQHAQRDTRTDTVFRVGELAGTRLRVALGSTGDGNLGAAAIASRAISTFEPLALLLVGVAGALKGEIDLGDVVVAERIYAYHSGKEQSERFLVRPRSFEASHKLLQLAHDLARESPEDVLGPDGEPRRFQVHFKPIASGEVVLDSEFGALREHLLAHYNDTAAIEMEGAGASVAAHINALPALVVRGISDRADGHKRAADATGSQVSAAENAAAFAAAILRDWSRELSPRTPERAVPEDTTRHMNQIVNASGEAVVNAVQGGDLHVRYIDADELDEGTARP